ncbi:MAG: PstS family phosphate ABC transporter substrate-binding protein [Actinomycetota bacterium]|nr:PstS family phosphate ABC transporter substrate-binding protein [Actinomycetota bacterium]
MKLIFRTLKRSKLLIAVAAFVALALLVVGCSSGTKTGQTSSKTSGNLSGTIKIDGSSTVAPISEAVAEEFMTVNPGVKVIVGISGTGGGFKKFTSGETDISDASRPIEDAEKALAKKNGIEYIEIPVAYDGISIVVNKNNNWAKDITVNELKKIWEPNSQVKTWKDIRPEWPNEKLILYGPGTDSGTFDYFTSEINGQEKASRADYTASEDDNVLVQGIAGDKGALGYFGYAYYVENKDKLNILSVNGVKPTEDTIKNGSYKPLSRPIFIYINKKALKRPEVKEFIRFYLTDGVQLIPEIGYIPLDKSSYDKSLGLIR